MKNNKFLFFSLATLFLIVLILFFSQNIWSKNPRTEDSPSIKNDLIIGGETDGQGCLIAAGYSWCEPQKKCLRVWEEPCFYDLDQSEIILLKQMFIDKYQRSAEDIEITVSQYEDNFVKGGVRFSLAGEFNTGGIFLAYKKDSIWQLAFDGNGLYNCAEMLQYDFPEYFIPECFANKDNIENLVETANPASVFCSQQNGQVEFRLDETGGQYGVCILADGTECEEWAFFRGECQQ